MVQHEGSQEYVYVAEQWEAGLDSATKALSELREIFPVYDWHVTETGSRALGEAIDHLESTILALHRAGRRVLGAEQYIVFMEQRSEHLTELNTERGEI